MLAETLIVSENESLILYDRSSGCGAKLIALKLRFGSSRLIKKVMCVECAITQKLEDASVKNVGAGLRDNRYLPSGPLPIFGAIGVLQNVELTDCVYADRKSVV